jgi:hypothetical protein
MPRKNTASIKPSPIPTETDLKIQRLEEHIESLLAKQSKDSDDKQYLNRTLELLKQSIEAFPKPDLIAELGEGGIAADAARFYKKYGTADMNKALKQMADDKQSNAPLVGSKGDLLFAIEVIENMCLARWEMEHGMYALEVRYPKTDSPSPTTTDPSEK